MVNAPAMLKKKNLNFFFNCLFEFEVNMKGKYVNCNENLQTPKKEKSNKNKYEG